MKPCSYEELDAALEKACRALDRRRKHVLYLSEERHKRVQILADKFTALCGHGLSAGELEKQVYELSKAAEDPSILRETLTILITKEMGGQTEWGMNLLADALHTDGPLEPLIARCLARIRQEDAGNSDFVRQMTAYADTHYMDESLSLQYIADNVVYRNADYIGREFTRAMGKKFSSYLWEVRMEHAKRLMRADGSLHSYEVAERVGLGGSPHYFSQLFRKYTGQTPTDFRRQFHGGPDTL